MVKHVMINEGSNQVKEYQFTELENQTKAYSKEELFRFKKQFQAESLMNQVRNMVTKIMIGKAGGQQNATRAVVEPQVDAIMSKSVDEILNFLAKNGVKLPPPPPPPPPRAGSNAPRAAPKAPPAVPASNGEEKIRQMVQQKLLKETDLRGAVLANKVDLIMSLPRPKILSILQREIPPPPPRPAGASMQKKKYNWIKECQDYWSYLPPPVVGALKVLGYNETLWNNNEQPALSDKAYTELTPEQQNAIRILGCSPQEWDNPTPPPPPPSAEDDKTPKKPVTPEERAMMLKIKEMVTFKLKTELNLTSQDPSEAILLNKAVMEILSLPKEGVQEYLRKPLLPPQIQAQFQPPPPEKLNWVWDSKAYWYALPPHIQDAAKVLGYDEVTWNHTEQPEESDMAWRHLSIRQQEAAITLGYTKDTWDEGNGDLYTGYSDAEDEKDEGSAVGENDSDDESDDFSESSEKESVAADDDESSVDEEEFISSFITQDEEDGAEDLVANFISADPSVVRELTKKDEVLDDDSDDGADIPYISNSILRRNSSDDDDDDDDFYANFRKEGKNRSSDVLTEDETESTEEKEKAPEEQKFSGQLETFMSLWSFKL
ncbi:unnamed protein product [Cylindrotheca closterium]|uniref:Uncharacterized protein n=1 Tax=Cylindrotheca closterium TaxID=2856 RepID=A0AAD2JH87_9STRA|nr:unnamed protein product [Cylindrotheca closterium]